jgi:hypothetical protein
LEQASQQDMQDFLQAVVKGAHSKYPIKKSDDETILDLVYKNNVLTYIRKVNYSKLLNLKNINHSREELTKALTIGMVTEVCSQKLLSYMLINKNISVEYKYNNSDMQLIDDIVVEKSNCQNWHNNNKTYAFINSVFELFEH